MDSTRRAIVTGGSRGIGRSVALKLAEDGFDVAFCYRSGSEAAAVTSELIQERGAKVYSAPCDVSDKAAVDDFVAQAEESLGEIDTLVNSAGITRDRPMVLMGAADWTDVIDTNLTGTFNTVRAVSYGFMKRRGGSIINISSVAGVYGNRGQTNYAASKAGIVGLSKSLAKELGSCGVRVNVVAPGFIETDMTGFLDEAGRKAVLGSIPLRRLGQSEDVAEMVSFLASDRAGYITGQVFQVDGGIVL